MKKLINLAGDTALNKKTFAVVTGLVLLSRLALATRTGWVYYFVHAKSDSNKSVRNAVGCLATVQFCIAKFQCDVGL
jgi:hypothetical protein